MSDLLNIDVTRAPDETTIRVGGEIDLASAPELRQAIEAACTEQPQNLVIDLADVTYCDSSGLNVFIRVADSCISGETKLRIKGADPTIRRIFDVTGLSELLDDSP